MTFLEIFTIVASMLGGLALFLLGMDTMSTSLGEMTGGVLEKLTDTISKNQFTAFIFGFVITSIVQSVSATSVLCVGLVNAGVIALEKAIGVIIGACLGTTINAWILSLNALDGASFLMTIVKPSSFSPFLAIIGIGLGMFAKSQKTKTAGSALLGFSVMMIGMSMMGQAVSPLRDVPALKSMLISFSNPILGFMFAVFFTMLIQSSDACIGILLALSLSVEVTFGSAIPLICGAQVGTCITAIISSIGASNNGKRTALMNLYYNLLKTISFMAIFYLLNTFVHFSFLDETVGVIGIPAMHTFINLVGIAIWMPLNKVIINLVRRTIPLNEEEKELKVNELTMLDPLLLVTPSFALDQTERGINMLAETVNEAFYNLTILLKNPESEETVISLCKRAETYKDQIDRYLRNISSKKMRDKDTIEHAFLVHVNTALGRVGVITLQLLEQRKKVYDMKLELSDRDRKEVEVFGEAMNEILDITVTGLKLREATIYSTIQLYREEISRLATLVSLRHIENMHKRERNHSLSGAVSYVVYAEERIINACDVIADELYKFAVANGTLKESESDNEKRRRMIKKLFEDKYELLGFDTE